MSPAKQSRELAYSRDVVSAADQPQHTRTNQDTGRDKGQDGADAGDFAKQGADGSSQQKQGNLGKQCHGSSPGKNLLAMETPESIRHERVITSPAKCRDMSGPEHTLGGKRYSESSGSPTKTFPHLDQWRFFLGCAVTDWIQLFLELLDLRPGSFQAGHLGDMKQRLAFIH